MVSFKIVTYQTVIVVPACPQDRIQVRQGDVAALHRLFGRTSGLLRAGAHWEIHAVSCSAAPLSLNECGGRT